MKTPRHSIRDTLEDALLESEQDMLQLDEQTEEIESDNVKEKASFRKRLKDRTWRNPLFRSNPLNSAILKSLFEVRLDKTIFGVALALTLLGLIMVASSSIGFAEYRYGDSLYHTKRHLMYLAMGIIFASVVFMVPMKICEKYSGFLLILGFVLLALVLVPGVGSKVNGAQRWIRIAGFTLQSTEIAKFCLVMYLAGYLVRRQHELVATWRGFLKPMLVLSVFCFLVYMEPDFGALVVLASTCLGMMFLAGLGIRQLIVFGVGSGSLMTIMILSSTYRKARVDAFIDSLSEPFADQFGRGYQLAQSLIAIGRGEWFGVGLGNSVQKLFYLPEAHTDFVFAIMAEELGLIGVLVVISLFMVLIGRSLYVGKRAELAGHHFAANVIYGFSLIIAAQTFINIGVNCGLLPTKGLTLPFLSYGGSSLIICCVFVAVILRANYEVIGSTPRLNKKHQILKQQKPRRQNSVNAKGFKEVAC